LINIIEKFINKDGIYVFASSFVYKICNFLTAILLVRILSPEDFGVLSYTLSSLAFFVPFAGGGLQYSFLHFAPLYRESQDRNSLFFVSLYKGLFLSIGVLIILYFCIPWLSSGWPDSKNYFYVLGFYLFGFFIIDLVKNRFRVENSNKKFAGIELTCALIVFISSLLMAYLYGVLAYLITIVSVPILIGLIHIKGQYKSIIKIPDNYISYGLWVAFGAVASQLMYSLDLFFIGRILQDPQQVALYRSASILPIALFFIPNAYITTYYADLAENFTSKSFLKIFIKDYLKLFSVIGIIFCGILFFCSEFIIGGIFGSSYLDAVSPFKILVLGMFGAFIIRIPFGNLLAAVGKSKWNAMVSLFMLLLNGFLNYFAITAWGIKGAAIVTCLVFWLSGIVSATLYLYYLSRIS
tara:strand:- start:2399 stop:3628 length:1230 start_codon:yes stop_codon:yes gene_type:complete